MVIMSRLGFTQAGHESWSLISVFENQLSIVLRMMNLMVAVGMVIASIHELDMALFSRGFAR
jgi:hypothetical protein